MKVFLEGDKPGRGTYFCRTCNAMQFLFSNDDKLKCCPKCKGIDFRTV